MAVIAVGEIGPGRKHTYSRDWTRTYERQFRVETDSAETGPIEVRDALLSLATPVGMGSRYDIGSEFDNGSFAGEISCECTDSDGKGWIVTVSYTAVDPAQKPENPLEHPLEIEGGFAPFDRIVDEDQDGNAVVNAAYDYFDPPVTVEDPRPTLTLVRNEAAIDWALIYMYRNAVNTDVFWGAAPGQVKVVGIKPKRMWDQYLAAYNITPGGYYWVTTYEFDFNPDGWHSKVLNQGMRQLVSGVQTQISIGGIPITSPALLDATGAVLTPGADPVYLEFVVYPEKEFSIFNLNNPGP
jgi:hypothetical protein